MYNDALSTSSKQGSYSSDFDGDRYRPRDRSRTEGTPFIENFRKQQEEQKNKMKIMSCLTIIVEDTIDQIHIVSGGRHSDDALRKFYLNIKERTAETFLEDPIYDMRSGDPYAEAFAKKKVAKNFEDSATCRELLTIIKNELKTKRSFEGAKKIIRIIEAKKSAETNLLKEEADNYRKMKEYKHNLITHTRDFQLEMQKVNALLSASKEKNQQRLCTNLLRVRYIKTWEAARQEQNILTCRKLETELQDIISKYTSEINKEIRAHVEICSYVSENLDTLESKIKYWSSRYDSEMESQNVQIQLIRERQEDQKIKLHDLKLLFALHKKQIEDFKKYKENKMKLDELNEKKEIASIRIQAWWRGIMVRHRLGSFNPNKKKGKTRKGSGKDKRNKKK